MPYRIIQVNEYWRSRPRRRTSAEKASGSHGPRRRSKRRRKVTGI